MSGPSDIVQEIRHQRKAWQDRHRAAPTYVYLTPEARADLQREAVGVLSLATFEGLRVHVKPGQMAPVKVGAVATLEGWL